MIVLLFTLISIQCEELPSKQKLEGLRSLLKIEHENETAIMSSVNKEEI